MESEIKNAKITSTLLGKEDPGPFTACLFLDYGGSTQVFDGYCLDKPKPDKVRERVGSDFGMEFIIRILETLEVEIWERLPGTYCRVVAEDCRVHAIGHIIKNRWFHPEKLAKEYFEEK